MRLFVTDAPTRRFVGNEDILLMPRTSMAFVHEYLGEYRRYFPKAKHVVVPSGIWHEIMGGDRGDVPESLVAAVAAALIAGEI